MRITFATWHIASTWIGSSASGSVPERLHLRNNMVEMLPEHPVFTVRKCTADDVAVVVASAIPGMLVLLP